MIISRTPVRISLFGGGTDYREYFECHGGAVLGSTIDKYVYVSVNPLSDFFEYKIRVGYSKAELVNRVDDIVHPSVRETLKFYKVEGNLDIHIFADLPARTGLGSSSAFTAGFLNALYAMDGRRVSKQRLAEEVVYIEQEMIQESVGCQDQFHAAFGGLNVIEFAKEGIAVRPVVISKEKRWLLEESMMSFYTGLTRYASDILKEQVNNTKNGSKDKHLARMREMVYEAEHIIADESPEAMIKGLGELLREGWELKKALSGKVSNGLIDQMYKSALEAGAYGGKISGAGGGGFLTLIVPTDKQPVVRQALMGQLEVKFRFENDGSTIIYLSDVYGQAGCHYTGGWERHTIEERSLGHTQAAGQRGRKALSRHTAGLTGAV
jgi:D-glycero-alpha-D-manno-heptose-7-phosphate kinase